MKKARHESDEVREPYDFRGGVRGKHAARYAEGTNVVVLDPDVAKMFPDGESVNEAQRAVGKVVERRKAKPNKPVQTDRPTRGG